MKIKKLKNGKWGIWFPLSECSKEFQEFSPLAGGRWMEEEFPTKMAALAVRRERLSWTLTPEGVDRAIEALKKGEK